MVSVWREIRLMEGNHGSQSCRPFPKPWGLSEGAKALIYASLFIHVLNLWSEECDFEPQTFFSLLHLYHSTWEKSVGEQEGDALFHNRSAPAKPCSWIAHLMLNCCTFEKWLEEGLCLCTCFDRFWQMMPPPPPKRKCLFSYLFKDHIVLPHHKDSCFNS